MASRTNTLPARKEGATMSGSAFIVTL
jgi:hypothetical protein